LYNTNHATQLGIANAYNIQVLLKSMEHIINDSETNPTNNTPRPCENKESQSWQAAGYSLTPRTKVLGCAQESKILDGVKLGERAKVQSITPNLSNQNPRMFGYLAYGTLLGIACSIECARDIRERFEDICSSTLDNPSWYLFKYEVESYLPFFPVLL